MYFQPPNSPDLNVLDSRLFWSMNTSYLKSPGMNFNDLYNKVIEMFEQYPYETIEKVFIILQAVMNSIIMVGGSNHYKLPHFTKACNFTPETITYRMSLNVTGAVADWDCFFTISQNHNYLQGLYQFSEEERELIRWLIFYYI